MDIQPNEQKRIDKFGFNVTMAGSQYVVRHPKLPRIKHEGGNLSAMLTAAEMDLEAREKKGSAAKPPAASKITAAKAAKAVRKAAEPSVKSNEAAQPSSPTAAKDKPEPKPPRAAKVKRSQGDWKTYQIGKLILRNPDKTPEEILAMCKEHKIDTKIMTIIGLTRYFRLCVKVLADIQSEKEGKA